MAEFFCEREKFLNELFINERSRCLFVLFVLKETELFIEMAIIQEVMRYIKTIRLFVNTREEVSEREIESSDDFVKGWPSLRILRIDVRCDLVFSERDDYEIVFESYFSQSSVRVHCRELLKTPENDLTIEIQQHRKNLCVYPYIGWNGRAMLQWKEYLFRSTGKNKIIEKES